ncbi:hypothetical protein J6590_066247 [Homalodisca vitripennis]|nr:hypothetical protein J6590_066247 [Homalodisca vitripennis]
MNACPHKRVFNSSTDCPIRQKRFWWIGFLYHEESVEDLSWELGLQPLEKRRFVANLVFLHKVINSGVDFPDLLRLINLKTPPSTLSADLFAPSPNELCSRQRNDTSPENRKWHIRECGLFQS